jgi:hypothetical protein
MKLTGNDIKLKDEKRFWLKVECLSDNNACWLWKACCSNKGYGLFRLFGFMQNAHRVAYALTKEDPG